MQLYGLYARVCSKFLLFEAAKCDLARYHFQCNIHVLLSSVHHILDNFMMIGRPEQMQTRETAICNNDSLFIVLNACKQETRNRKL